MKQPHPVLLGYRERFLGDLVEPRRAQGHQDIDASLPGVRPDPCFDLEFPHPRHGPRFHTGAPSHGKGLCLGNHHGIPAPYLSFKLTCGNQLYGSGWNRVPFFPGFPCNALPGTPDVADEDETDPGGDGHAFDEVALEPVGERYQDPVRAVTTSPGLLEYVEIGLLLALHDPDLAIGHPSYYVDALELGVARRAMLGLQVVHDDQGELGFDAVLPLLPGSPGMAHDE